MAETPQKIDDGGRAFPKPIGIIYPPVQGRAPRWRFVTPRMIYRQVLKELLTRPWLTYCIHMPSGWKGSMAGGQWFTLRKGFAQAYTDAIGEALGRRPEIEIGIYGPSQWYSAYSTQGRAMRPFVDFQLADPADDTTRRTMVETVKAWVDRGITGWIFDSGSRKPGFVSGWERIFRKEIDHDMTVGLETIPITLPQGTVDWSWANQAGLHYHGLLRYREGRPFEETVPRGVNAFVWLIWNHPVPTVQGLRELMARGWGIATDIRDDQLVLAALKTREVRDA